MVNTPPMHLKQFLSGMTLKQRSAFAERCGTSGGQLRNIAYGYKRCAESLAINIERESARQVLCEELRPDVDWQFIRGTTNAGEVK
jgi:DNA-binding transcriptional regulator YdaS (Cro superfamily)